MLFMIKINRIISVKAKLIAGVYDFMGILNIFLQLGWCVYEFGGQYVATNMKSLPFSWGGCNRYGYEFDEKWVGMGMKILTRHEQWIGGG